MAGLLNEMKDDVDCLASMLQQMIDDGATQKRFDVFEKLLYALAGKDRRLRYKLKQLEKLANETLSIILEGKKSGDNPVHS